MNKVVTNDYYGQFESIEGLEAVPSHVWVHWPNRKVEKLRVKESLGQGSAQVDMNRYPDQFPTRQLFVCVKVNGVSVEVPLKRLKFQVTTPK